MKEHGLGQGLKKFTLLLKLRQDSNPRFVITIETISLLDHAAKVVITFLPKTNGGR